MVWRGVELEGDLTWDYFNLLEEEYNIENPDLENFSNIPEEFKTDAWWKKRGL